MKLEKKNTVVGDLETCKDAHRRHVSLITSSSMTRITTPAASTKECGWNKDGKKAK
jgi:hypothetical protein